MYYLYKQGTWKELKIAYKSCAYIHLLTKTVNCKWNINLLCFFNSSLIFGPPASTTALDTPAVKQI